MPSDSPAMPADEPVTGAPAVQPPPVAPARGSGGRPAAAGRPADPYAWMRDTSDPELLAYLAAERDYYQRQMAHTAALRAELAAEMEARTAQAEESVGWRRGPWRYFTQTLPGLNYEQFCRRPETAEPGQSPQAPGPQVPPGGTGAQVLLDENTLLDDPDCTGGYVALGVREVSPDHRLLAYSVDFDGDEVYQLRIRDLATGADLPARVEHTYYGLAWSADSRSLFYVIHDAIYRPYQVWRHELGTDPATDVCVFEEKDERFDITVRASRSGAWIFIDSESRDTTETLVIPAASPGSPPAVLQHRRNGTEYRADHADGPGGGEFCIVTNDGAQEYRLVRAPVTDPGAHAWVEVIPGSADTRLVSCDVFGRYLIVSQRRGAATQLRIVDRETWAERVAEAGGPEMWLELAGNEEYHADAVTVRVESLIHPPSWHDVDLASGRWRLRKRREVPGYDPGRYQTRRITAAASDGTPIPVTLAYRAGLPRDGTAPCLLYGYGAYESCLWPDFSLTVASLLDRGYVYAVAHIRGGGEGGRRWWLDGRLDRKRNTFTDFIAAAGTLAGEGWAAGDRIVSRGLSAGGLLQGAVFSMAPGRWRAVVAEVPFVDCVTSMLDPTTPLTIGERDEWGDPRDPVVRAYMESYSPYENVPAGPRPDLLVTGALHDPRVGVYEPAKWVARLRATDTAGSRVLFRPELGAGAHGGPAGRYDKLGYEAEVLAFVLDAAGEGPTG